MLSLALAALAAAPQSPAHAHPHAATPPATGMHWGDYDADGFPDAVALLPGGEARLLRNLGDGTLEDVTALVGLPDALSAKLALWGDYDADGALDLYLGSLDGESRLWRQAAGTFQDMTERLGLEPNVAPLAARWIDYDGDGTADLHLSTASGEVLYHGLGGTAFERVDLGLSAPVTGANAPTGAARVAGASPVAGAPATAGSRPDRADSDTARTGGAGGRTDLTVSGVTRAPGGTAAVGTGICVDGLFDQAGGACLEASRSPTLGRLFPLSPELFVELATGNVGVGTVSPEVRLQVHSGSDVSVGGGGYLQLGSQSSGNIAIDNNEIMARSNGAPAGLNLNFDGGDVLLLGNSSTGDVGIGTSSPNDRLDVVGNIRSRGSSGGRFSAYNPGNQSASVSLDWLNDRARIRVGGSGTGAQDGLDIQTTGDASLMRIDGTGNVGIGTTSPEVRLHVPSGSDVGVGGGGYLQLGSQSGSNIAVDDNEIMARSNGMAATLNLNLDGGDIVLGGAGTTGSVGIGSASPGAKLYVEGPSSEDALRVRVDGTTRFLVDRFGNVAVGGNFSPTFDLEVSGTAAKPGGGSWTNSSDRRLKKNIADLEGALDTLLALRGVTFEYIDPEGIHELPGERIGFVAQEVETVIPDWVGEKPDGMKMLTVRGFEALAVEALRELDRENSELAGEVGLLRHRNAALEVRVERLESVEADLASLRASFEALADRR